jgi:hypothetical protein
MSKDNKANLKPHYRAYSEPQRGILTKFIRFIFNVLFMAVVIIIALSIVAACQPKMVTTANSMEGKP